MKNQNVFTKKSVIKRVFTVSALMISTILFQGSGLAGDVIISPSEIVFGDVAVGQQRAAELVISHTANSQVEAVISLTSTCPDFSLGATPNPLLIPASANARMVITYAPSKPGLCSGTIHIGFAWITPFKRTDLGMRTVSVTGNGVAPEELPVNMGSILRFYDASVAAKTLEGKGKGRQNSAIRRIEALRKMLEQADKLIRKGKMEKACNILNGVYRKIDGKGRPDSTPDFAKGDALPELAYMVGGAMADLGCP